MAIRPKAFNAAACIAKVAAKGRMSEEDAKQLLADVAVRAEKMRRTGVPDPFVAAASKLAERALQDARDGAVDATRNAGLRAKAVARIVSRKVEDWALNTRAILVSENGADMQNVANFSGARFKEWSAVLTSNLRQAGLLGYAKSEAALKDISAAMFDIRQGMASTKAAPRANDPAYEAARIIMRTMQTVHMRLNGEGARINDAIDYVFHTSHNLELMLQGGRGQPLTPTIDGAFRSWWNTIQPLLHPKTFDDVTPRTGETQAQANERFAKSAFVAMTTNNHGLFVDPGEAGVKFEGTRNLARKISQGRVFFFKDGESWANYMKVYGKQLNALELAYDTISSGSNAVGLLHFLGTNPAANMRRIIQQVIDQHKDLQHVEAIRKYQEDLQGNRLKLLPGIEDLLAQVGATPSPPITKMERRFSTALKVVNMDTLGSVGVTHAMSLPATFSLAGRGLDLNTFQIMGNLLKSMLPHSADHIATLSEMGAHLDGLEVHNPYDNGVTVPGVISSMHSAFMTATGIRYIMRHAKEGFVWMLSNHLVNQSMKTFTQLGPMLQQTMKQFGLNSTKWDLIRGMAKTEAGGRKYIAPSSALHIDDATLTAATGLTDPYAMNLYRQELGDQLQMFYSRMGDLSTVTPGARERAILHGAGRGADLSSLFTQFSAWPLAATHQLLAKTIYESQSRSKAFWALGTAASLSMLAGYVRMTIRDLASGRPPEDPQNGYQAAFLGLRAMMAGGIGGVIGDHLFGQIGQAVQDGPSIGGPMIGNIAKLAQIAGKYTRSLSTGQKYDPWPDLVHLGTANVPFANLFYLKGAFDYLLFYHIFDTVQPGWWEKMNLARERRGEGTMAGYMPGAPIPYNPLTPLTGAINALTRTIGPERYGGGSPPEIIGIRG